MNLKVNIVLEYYNKEKIQYKLKLLLEKLRLCLEILKIMKLK